MMQRCKQSFRRKKALGLQTVRAGKAGGASGHELRRTWKKTAIKVVGECGQVSAITEGWSVERKQNNSGHTGFKPDKEYSRKVMEKGVLTAKRC